MNYLADVIVDDKIKAIPNTLITKDARRLLKVKTQSLLSLFLQTIILDLPIMSSKSGVICKNVARNCIENHIKQNTNEGYDDLTLDCVNDPILLTLYLVFDGKVAHFATTSDATTQSRMIDNSMRAMCQSNNANQEDTTTNDIIKNIMSTVHTDSRKALLNNVTKTSSINTLARPLIVALASEMDSLLGSYVGSHCRHLLDMILSILKNPQLSSDPPFDIARCALYLTIRAVLVSHNQPKYQSKVIKSASKILNLTLKRLNKVAWLLFSAAIVDVALPMIYRSVIDVNGSVHRLSSLVQMLQRVKYSEHEKSRLLKQFFIKHNHEFVALEAAVPVHSAEAVMLAAVVDFSFA